MSRRTITVLVASLALACTPVFASSSFAGSGGGSGASATSAAADAPATAAASCKTVRYGGRSYILFRKGVRCVFAKRWVRRLNRSRGRNKPAGFKCTSGSKYRTGGQCVRGKRVFGWHPGD